MIVFICVIICRGIECLYLTCGYSQVMSNEDAVGIARQTRDPQKASKLLVAEALRRESKDDISCVVVRFRA